MILPICLDKLIINDGPPLHLLQNSVGSIFLSKAERIILAFGLDIVSSIEFSCMLPSFITPS